MAQPPPLSKDVQEFQFRLQCKLKIFDYENDSVLYNSSNLITAASRYGLVFVGNPQSTFEVIKLRDIELLTIKEGETSDYPCRIIKLPSKPSHLKINCDNSLLAVCITDNNCPAGIFYNVVSFYKQTVITVIKSLRLSPNPGVTVTSAGWNPTIPSLFTVCKSDGSLSLYEFKGTGIEIHELPSDAKATCMCWSPKGKQLVVGNQEGRLIQYKPDLKAVKAIDAPPLELPHSAVAVDWLSNYQFAAVYQSTDKSSPAMVMIIDAPKAGNVMYTNFEDISYGYANAQQTQFYLEHIPAWGTLLIGSANSIEVGVLGGEAERWTQWIQDDGNRCELPLGPQHQDTFPVGLAIATGTTLTLKKDFKSEDTIPPAPLLLLLSNHGLLCCFSIINLLPGIPQICSPPETIPDQSGMFIKQVKAQAAPQPQQQQPVKPSPQAAMPLQSMFQVPPQQQQKIQEPLTIPTFTVQQPIKPPPPEYKPTPIAITAAPPAFPTMQMPSITVPAMKPSHPAPPAATVTVEPQQPLPKVSPPKEAPAKPDPAEDLAVKNAQITLLTNSIKEECINFQSELRQVLEQSRKIKVELGTDQEHVSMIQTADNLTQFQAELMSTTTSQAAEIHYLKQSLMQAFAWCEDARSRHLRFADPALSSLMRAQELDPVNKTRLANLHHLLYYLESQLRQVDNTLDEQWSTFQDSCKKTMKIQIPTLEAVYQSMVRQNAILMKQNFILKDIGSRVKSNTKKGSLLTSSKGNIDDLTRDVKSLEIEPTDAMQGRYQRVVAREQRFSAAKQEKLRNFFGSRNVTHISTTKPCLSSSILNLTPTKESLKKMHPAFSSTAVNTPSGAKKNLFPDISALDSFAGDDVLLSPVQKTQPPPPQSTPKQPFAFKPVMQQETVKTAAVSSAPLFGNLKTPLFATSQPSPFQQPISFAVPKPTVTTTSTFKFNAPQQPSFSTAAQTTLFKPETSASITVPKVSLSFGTPQITVATENKQQETVVPASVSIFKVPEPAKVQALGTAFSTFGTKPTTVVTSTNEAKPQVTPFSSVTSLFKSGSQTMLPTFGTSSGGSAFAPLSGSAFGGTSLFSSTTKTSGSVAVTTTASPAISVSSEVPKPSLFSSPVSLASVPSTTAASLFTATPSPPKIISIPSIVSTPKTPTLKELVSATVEQKDTSSAAIISAVTPTIPGNEPITTITPVVQTPPTQDANKTESPSPAVTPTSSVPFATPTTATAPVSAFVQPSTTASSVFGGSSLFGALSSGTSTATSIFAGAAAGTTSKPVFGIETPTFGSAGTNLFEATAVSTPPPSFGSPAAATTTVTTSSVFGTADSSTPGSLFGSAATPATQPQKNIFGSATITPPISSVSNVFAAASSAGTPGNVFGSPTTTSSSGNIFGGASSTFGSASSGSSIFGQSTESKAAAFGSGGSIFGATPSFGSGASPASAAPFGSSGGGSIFGAASPQTATTTTSNIFGTPVSSTNTFGSTTNIFGAKPADTTSPSFGTFGSSNENKPEGSSFSFGNLSVSALSAGGNATPASTSFSQNPFAAKFAPENNATTTFMGQNVCSPFGASNASSGGSIFGGAPATTSSSGSIFGGGASAQSSGSGFGAPSAGAGAFGGSPTFGGSGSIFGQQQQQQSPFGQQSAFGSTAFGSSPSAFGSTSPGAGSFSMASQSVGQTGFGGFQKPASAFGAAPVFGSSSPGGFGAAPSFGGAPSFGSPSKVFGAPQAQAPAAFGSPTQENPTFANLANQSTLGFGSLAQAQQKAPTAAPAFSGGTSFSSWR